MQRYFFSTSYIILLEEFLVVWPGQEKIEKLLIFQTESEVETGSDQYAKSRILMLGCRIKIELRAFQQFYA